MTDEQLVINDLIPMLKDYLDSSNTDRVATKEMISDVKSVIEETRKCGIEMKLQIQKLETNTKNFGENCKHREDFCDKRFSNFEKKLEVIPPPEMMKERDKKMTALTLKIETIMPTFYKAMGAAVVVIAIITSVLGWVMPVLLKRFIIV